MNVCFKQTIITQLIRILTDSFILLSCPLCIDGVSTFTLIISSTFSYFTNLKTKFAKLKMYF